MKNAIYIVVIVVVLGAIAGIYMFFLRPQSAVPTAAVEQRSQLLPYGTEFNTSTLSNSNLKDLQSIGTIGDVNGSGNTHPFGK